MCLDNKKSNIILFICMLFFVCVSFFEQPKYSEKYLINNAGSVKINRLTNFQWDYVKLFVDNIDFQKVIFYKDEKIILQKQIDIDSSGELLTQVLFESKDQELHKEIQNEITYYKCFYSTGKLNFVEIAQIKHSNEENRFLYIYNPENCQKVLYQEYLKEFR